MTYKGRHWGCSVRTGVLTNFAKIHRKTPVSEFLLMKLQDSVCNFIKKETLAQVFSCEICEISKNTCFYRTPPVAATVYKEAFLTNFSISIGKHLYMTKLKHSFC